MARQVLPWVGMAVGAYFGNPQLGYAIGSIIGNAVDPQILKGPKLGDGQVQTSAEGVYRPIVLGTGPVMGNIIHRGPEVVRRSRQSQGKGGPKVETERRYRTFAIRIAEGPIAGVTRIWMDEKLVYDVRPNSGLVNESIQYARGFRLYLGDESQMPDPSLEAYRGIGNVNSYRGTAYVVFPNFDLTDFGDRVPQFRFEVASEVTIDGNSYATLPAVGRIMTSGDGLSWGGSIDTGLGEPIRMIKALGSKLFVFSASGKARVSSDRAVTFTDVNGLEDRRSESEIPSLMDYDNGVWIVVYTAGGYVFRSTDGVNFTKIVHGVVRSWSALGGRNGNWIIGGTSSFVMLSSNGGVTWESVSATPGDLSGLVKGGIYFYAVTGGNLLRTVNGQPGTWESKPGPWSVFAKIYLSYKDGRVVVSSGPDVFYLDGWGSDWNSGGSFTAGISGSPPDNNLVNNGIRFIVGLDGQVIDSSLDVSEWVESYDGNTYGTPLVAAEPGIKIASGSVTLSAIVSFVHQRCGSGPNDYNTAQLTDPVDGLVIAGDYTSADCIRTLMPVYMFDSSEHDIGAGFRVNYVKRGGPVSLTLTINDMVDEPEESVREDALERPQKLHMHFQSPSVGYAPAKATSMRNSPDILVSGEVSVSVPVVFKDVNEAWRRAGVLHQVTWSEVAGTQDLVVSDSLLEIVPTDNIGLILRGQQRRLRVTEVETVEGMIKCKMIADRQSAYTSNLTGVPLPEPTPPPSSIVGPSVFAFLDIPALNDNNDRLLYYMAVTGQEPAWHGAMIQRSFDGGANYEDVLAIRQNTIMGVITAPVSDASEHYTDTTNAVRVQLYTDNELLSLTQQQFLSEGGAFALEKPDGGWELMQYRDAEPDDEDGYVLTNLLRGRLNSGTSSHLVGARFVLLEGVYAIPAETSMIGQAITHRVISAGTSPELAPVSTDIYTAKSQTEWPVAHIIDLGSSAVRIVPRHRFGTEDRPVRSLNWQGYRIEADDGADSETVDTISDAHVFDPDISYPFTVTAAQINRFTGPGPAVSKELV